MLKGPAASIAIFVLAACSTAEQPVRSRDRARLEEILESQRRAHLELDADLLVEHVAERLLSVDRGSIVVQTRDQVREMFVSYFDGASYFAWEDSEPPWIQVSADGAMAWVVRRVEVDREEPDGSGGRRRRLAVSAYTSTFEKIDGEWRMTSVTSTFVPPESMER